MGYVAELRSGVANGERHRGVGDPVVENASVVICRVVDLEVQLQGLLVGPEPLSGDIADCRVRSDFHREPRIADTIPIRVSEGGAVVVDEHLGNLGEDLVGGVGTDVDVLREQELSDDELA